MMQLVVYEVVCPLLHGFCASGELGQVRPHAERRLCSTLLVCISQIVDKPVTAIWHDSKINNIGLFSALACSQLSSPEGHCLSLPMTYSPYAIRSN